MKNTIETIAVAGVYICDKTHLDFHKIVISIFSAYLTSICLKFFRKQIDKMAIK